jgi:hypothetical protein
MSEIVLEENIHVTNKGTGAGGANTNYHGKKFEETTSNRERLLEAGFSKYSMVKHSEKNSDCCLKKRHDDRMVVFVEQGALKKFMKIKLHIDTFRNPDEAYITIFPDGKIKIHILEKKEQNVEGSVETKLWSGPSLKREYELVLGEVLGENVEVFYGFCVSNYLKKKLVSGVKKYEILNTILHENNIVVLFGDDENYFETLDSWLNSSL